MRGARQRAKRVESFDAHDTDGEFGESAHADEIEGISMKDWLIGIVVAAFLALFATWLYAPHVVQHWLDSLFMH
jgi:hypothetical protein